MLGKTYDSEVCSAARALELVGERWTLLIVRNALFGGTTKFSDFHRDLGIATNILQTRLAGLVQAGVMERRRYAQDPDLYEYPLTTKGLELVPVILALTEWGDRWMAPNGPPMLYYHSVCGSDISQRTECAACGQLDNMAEVQARPGPGMPAGRGP